ncbi:hypothetical protein CAEBREN_24348 [Caenorhabditis brenneri]|uniref:Chromo domain-containing protein n=1 Tax=Caenorhabditis brenneri TaxID=135651 RepID=G0MBK1_CAEBE|nr:hypothetical protein CAEBREN_24348 [Caenorhabditis brenneri]
MSSNGGCAKRKRKGRRRSKPVSDELYTVESIDGARFNADNNLELLVKWEGYEETDWEPVENITGAPDCIKDFVEKFSDSLTDTLEEANPEPDAPTQEEDQEGTSTSDTPDSSAPVPVSPPPPQVFGPMELNAEDSAGDLLVCILGCHKEHDGSERYFVRLFNNQTEYWPMDKVKKRNPVMFAQFHERRRDPWVVALPPFF